ncbi:MAG: aminopeptidase [Gammaproteobacteria bacterium]|nr:aminopeptidase [Gammaproteobacteria bacterium]NNF60970.1 aminopeptidase [Gammaproteobacteria bacterium]NNM21258.1 aminopeptidase [Gammaproteobacteria bacterium]
MRALLSVLVISLLLPAAGCVRAGYYLQSVRGQLDLMSRRVDIEELLADPDTPAHLRSRLLSITEMRQFASAELGLPDNPSYRSYADLERPYVVWNVFAAPEFAVEPQTWCFLFVGCISYRGYFSEQKAQEYAAGLAAQGMDVYVAGIAAYSTLGRFADPVLNTMLAGDDLYLAGLIFHELSHQQLYIKDATTFNESFATMVEEEGVRRWLARRDDEDAWLRWQRQERRAAQFTTLIVETRDRLAALYRSDLDSAHMRSAKAEIIAGMRAAHDRLRQQWGGYSGYERWFSGPLNNAQLSSVATYQAQVPAFRALLSEADGDLRLFYQRAREIGELPREERDRRMSELAESLPGQAD